MAYNSSHSGPEIDAAVQMLGQVQEARDSTSEDLAEVKTLATQVNTNTSQVVSKAAIVDTKTAQVLTAALEVDQARTDVIAAAPEAVTARDQAVASAQAAQTSRTSANASATAASQSQVAAGLSEQMTAQNAVQVAADRANVQTLAQQVDTKAGVVAQTATDLVSDLNNKRFNTYVELLAYTPKINGFQGRVTDDPNPALNGFYDWNLATATWTKPAVQLVLSPALDALRTQVSTKKRPSDKNSFNAPLILAAAGAQILFGTHQKVPSGPLQTKGTVAMVGDTPLLPMRTMLRPSSENFPDAETLIMSGDSVMMESGGSVIPVTPVAAYDAKLIQEQNQPTAPTRYVTISGGQVIAYGPVGPTQLTQAGAWLAAQAVAFDIVRALKSNTPNPQPHTITKDGRIYRDGQVLLHKLSVGQSLALGSRGIVPDPAGDYTIGGVRGNLVSPVTPAGYLDKLWTLAGGPRPANWEGTTAFEPVREYVAVPLGETPATSYMLSMRKWHERATSVSPQMLYSVSAVGGTAYAGLKKGTTPYANAISQVTTAKGIANSMGLDYVVPSISIVHGESQSNTTQAEYVAMQAEWISDYRADIVAITGQAVPPVAFISQMLTGDPGTIPAIPLAQLQAHNENPNIIMIGPKYQFPYFDQYHGTAELYYKMGEMEARAERLTQVSGKWQPLRVLSATVSGAVITLRLNNLPNGNAGTPGPIGRLVADPVLVSDPGNFGFQLSTGTISNVAIARDGASITITTTAVITAGTVLTYALQPSLGSPQSGNGRRGCIRDTDMRDSSRFDAKPLYNWLCAFSMTLEV